MCVAKSVALVLQTVWRVSIHLFLCFYVFYFKLAYIYKKYPSGTETESQKGFLCLAEVERSVYRLKQTVTGTNLTA